MAKMKAKATYEEGVFVAEFLKTELKMAHAAKWAMEDAADLAKRGGRARIGAAGFSKKWQNGLRADAYPEGRASLNAAAHIYHKFHYALAFEEGATVRGKPLLWIPLDTAPKKVGRMRMTVKRYLEKIGPLQYVSRPGKPPLLVTSVKVGKAASRRSELNRFTVPALKRGSTGKSAFKTRSVPMFVGVKQVKIPQKFNITGAVNMAAKKVGVFYYNHLEE